MTTDETFEQMFSRVVADNVLWRAERARKASERAARKDQPCVVCAGPVVQPLRGRPALACVPCRPEYKKLCRARWRENNPDKQKQTARDARAYRLRTQYGLLHEDWDALLISQAGRCALCEDPMYAPQVDHCHTTGRVRGLLCRSCNTSLGGLGDNEAGLRRALAYVRKES